MYADQRRLRNDTVSILRVFIGLRRHEMLDKKIASRLND